MPVTSTSVTTSALDMNTIAYAMAKNECGEKLPLRDVLLALGIDPVNQPTLRPLLSSLAFKAKYEGFVRELKESGESFKLKARVQAEELLATQWTIIHDPDAPASVRMKGIENIVEWADLKPKKAADAPPQQAISIHIDLGAATATAEAPAGSVEVIDVTPAPNPTLDAP